VKQELKLLDYNKIIMLDWKLSRYWLLRLLAFGLCPRAVWWNCIELLEETVVPHDNLMIVAADFSEMSLLLH